MASRKQRQYLGILGCILMVQIAVVSGGQVNITILNKAKDAGAVCLDGSPPAYFFEPGFGDGTSNWVVYLEGGGWCHSWESCVWRSQNGLGTSTQMTAQLNFTGILSNDENVNPAFYNWNKFLLKYCDGTSFTGDGEIMDPNNSTNKLFSKGQKIYDAMMEEALLIGLKDAKNALLTGGSAGGLATALHCDQFGNMLSSTNTKCLMDAGYFMLLKDPDGKPTHLGPIELPGSREEFFDDLVALHNIPAKNLPQSCASKMKLSLCYFPQNVAPDIQTPLFVLNSVFDAFQTMTTLKLTNITVNCTKGISCLPVEIERLQGLRNSMIDSVTGLGKSPSNGWYLDSCYLHVESLSDSWNNAYSLNGRTVANAVGDWYYNRSVVWEVDQQNSMPHLCF